MDLQPLCSFSILKLREGEDWVIAWGGNALRGKSGLHGQGAGQLPGGAIRHQHHREQTADGQGDEMQVLLLRIR